MGDHGNNKASRKDLKIYKIQWNETFFETIGEIRFRYGLQQRFEKRNRNAFDAEGLVPLEMFFYYSQKTDLLRHRSLSNSQSFRRL